MSTKRCREGDKGIVAIEVNKGDFLGELRTHLASSPL